jgi:hypothetical protein
MRSRLLLLALLLVTLQPRLALATIRLVPDNYASIQCGIEYADDGDTISVWGPPPGQSAPPYVYEENVVFPQNISLTVVNRSFLDTTLCSPSWDRVVIDGLQNGPTPSKSRW